MSAAEAFFGTPRSSRADRITKHTVEVLLGRKAEHWVVVQRTEQRLRQELHQIGLKYKLMSKPTVYEEQIFRDQGEEFRKRVRQTIKRFDSYINPFKLGIREVLADIVCNFVPIDPESREHVINAVYYRYFTKFEDQHFRFILQTLGFIFENDQVISYSNDLNYKYVSLIFVEQLRAYFQANNDKVLKRLYQRLNQIKREKEQDELGEGFWEDEDTELSQVSRVKGAKSQGAKQNQNEFCHTKIEMQNKEMQIKALQAKLFLREQNLVHITAGYLKDLQILREQLYRKEQQAPPFQETFEATFLDFTDVLDPTVKQLLQLHVTDLKLQFEKRTVDLIKTIGVQKDEMAQLRQQIQRLNNQLNIVDAPSDIVAKLLRVDDNPYRIWKYIADFKGNHFFKEVFELQKPVYGLNYQEINQLIMTNKGYEREYQVYKDTIYAEYQQFVQKCQSELTASKIRINELENQIAERDLKDEDYKKRLIENAAQIMGESQHQVISLLQDQVKVKLESLDQITRLYDQAKLKFIFRLWITIIRANKGGDLRKILIDQSFVDERIETAEKEIQLKEQQIQVLQQNNNELVLKCTDAIQQLNLINDSAQLWIKEIKQKDYTIFKLNEQLRQNTSQKQLVEQFCNKLIKLIDGKLNKMKFLEINLDDKSREVVKSIIENIRKLSFQQMRQITELKLQTELSIEGYKALIYKGLVDAEAQTDPIEFQTEKSSVRPNMESIPLTTPRAQNERLPSQNQRQITQNQENIDLSHKRGQASISPEVAKVTHLPIKEKKRYSLDVSGPQQFTNPILQSQNVLSRQGDATSRRQTPSTQVQPSKQPKQGINTRKFELSGGQKKQNLQPLAYQGAIQLIEYDDQEEANHHVKESRLSDRNKMNLRNQNKSVNFELPQSGQKSKRAIEQIEEHIQNNSSQKKQREPFERLYKDSREKAERIKSLKENLEMLEKSHWEDIVSLFSVKCSFATEFDKSSTRRLDEIPFKHQDTVSFRQQCYRDYYHRTKSQTPQKDRFRTWIFRQTNQIDQMFDQINEATCKYDQCIRQSATAGLPTTGDQQFLKAKNA